MRAGSLPGDADPVTAAHTVLVVDDQDIVRDVATMALERAGYRVLATGSPSAAIQLALETSGIDLLLTDVVMPEMDAFELAERIGSTIPGLRVLYTSGYTDAGAEGAFLQKPFSPAQLVEKVGSMLAAA